MHSSRRVDCAFRASVGRAMAGDEGGESSAAAPMEVEAPAAGTLPATKEKEYLEDGEALSAPIESAIKPGDLYASFKQAEADRDFLDVQEQYIKDEIKNLKRELIRTFFCFFLRRDRGRDRPSTA